MNDGRQALSGSGNDEISSAIELFRKMQTHCNFLEGMDSLGDLNNAEKLRELLKNEAYILAITAEKNRAMTVELQNAKTQANRLLVEQKQIISQKLSLEAKLDQTKSKLYDIDFEPY